MRPPFVQISFFVVLEYRHLGFQITRMDKQPLLKFIQENTPNIFVSPEGISAIADNFEEREIIKNDFLLRRGNVSGYFYLEEGMMRSFTFDSQNKEVTTFFHSSNKVVIEPSSFFLRLPSTESIQAITECRGYYTSFEKLNSLFHTVPEFREFGRAMLVQEFVAYKTQSLGRINKTAEERYLELLNTNKEVFQNAQLKHIASYLGITDTSLSRIRRELSRQK